MDRALRLRHVVAIAALAAAAPAHADSIPAGDFDLPFTTTQPGSASGLVLHTIYRNPAGRDAKPSPVRRFLYSMPEGAAFDGTAVPACKATDAELQQRARAACPPESIVGEGYLTAMTGIPGSEPVSTDATFFNSGDGMIELFTQPGANVFLAVDRAKFRQPNQFEAPAVPVTPGGPPDGESAPRDVFIVFPVKLGAGGKSFITTPPGCPDSRRWTAHLDWTNADGKSYTNQSTMPCAPSNVFTLGRVNVHRDGSAAVSVLVPGAGHLRASDGGVAPGAAKKRPKKVRNAIADPTGAGSVKLLLRPSRASRMRMARGKTVRLRLRVAFVPTGGSGAVQEVIVVLRQTRAVTAR